MEVHRIGRRFYSYEDLLARGHRYSRQHIRRLENLGYFPMHVVMGPGSEAQAFNAWVAEEIEAFEAARIAARDSKLKAAAERGAAPVKDDPCAGDVRDKHSSTTTAATAAWQAKRKAAGADEVRPETHERRLSGEDGARVLLPE